jgi:hypothetical protein
MVRYLQHEPVQNGSLVHLLAARMSNLSAYTEQILQTSIARAFYLLGCYEIMHEEVSIQNRVKMSLPSVDYESDHTMKRRHNETLSRLVSIWKPHVKNLVEARIGIKVFLY